MTELRNRTNTHEHHGSHREGERHSSIRFYRRSAHQKNGPLIAGLDQNQRWTPIPIHSTFCVNSCPSGLGPEKYSAKT